MYHTSTYINIKTIVVAVSFWLMNISLDFLPNTDLLIVMFLLVFIDLITGIVKAVLTGVARTSEGYRRTVVKFMQYGGAIVVGMAIKYLSLKHHDIGEVAKWADWFTNGLLVFIILIEITSILENIYAIDKNTAMSRYLIKPLLKFLTFQIKNNPVNKTDNDEKIS